MIDVTFRIVAKHIQPDLWAIFVNSDVMKGYLTNSEWTAFKSLLHPSSEADFTIQEVDENGKAL